MASGTQVSRINLGHWPRRVGGDSRDFVKPEIGSESQRPECDSDREYAKENRRRSVAGEVVGVGRARS